jgi:twinfilin-like protein
MLRSVSSQHPSESWANCIVLDLPAAIHEAFAEFRTDTSLLALPLALHNGLLEPLLPMHSGDSSNSFQTALNELNTVLNPRTPLYILLRRKDTLSAITFVPYLAKESQRAFFLDHRNELVRKLGNEHFSLSLICKEMGEIADARSWTERDENSSPQEFAYGHSNIEDCEDRGCEDCAVKDIGYKRNKCRLCDRRMKNYIAPEALEALKTLTKPGTVVQIVRSYDYFQLNRTLPLTPLVCKHDNRNP